MKTILYRAKDLAPTMSASPFAHRPVWRAGALATIIGAIAAAAYGWLLDLSGVPLVAGRPGGNEAQKVPLVSFAWGTAVLVVVATILAAVLTRRARRPRHTFVVTTGVLAIISVALPLAAGATATSTKVTFALGHLALAALIIPLIARDLPNARP